ncbi:MAG TPA: serine/threonine-protein kinase [Polyangiaceae bacterium]|nr:serine/threonine-protein kinase [Polyangiaceae bacterium]
MIATAESKPDLAKFEIREEIGHGGMATVYLARDKRLGRDVALKIIHRHLRENVEVAARFASEARAVAKLKHPNIVEVYDVSDEAEPERYLVVELVRGTTLRALIAQNERLPAEIAAIAGVEIAGALDHAHQFGVIHRDVKPENVLVALPTPGAPDVRASNADDTLIKITDFGIAKLLDAQGVTSTGQVLGSPAHMAPEQIEGGDVNARSDVFGLGVLLYEAMVGRLPFDGKNPAQVLRRVLDGAFTPADKARPSVGQRFAAIVGKALAHDPAQRYASAEEVGTALREELTRLGFVDLRGELRAFLVDPKAYQAAYEPRLVERLVTLATEARAKKDIPESAAYLNRALALRPDDTSILAAVSSLSRAERLRRNLRSAALAIGASAVVAAVAFGVSRIESKRPAVVEARLAPSAKGPAPGTSAAAAAPSAEPETTDEKPHVVPRKPPLRAVGGGSASRTAPSASAAPSMARVRIAVDGPANTIVRVDGADLADWFGTQEIAVGTHVFDFIAPNAECCESGDRQTVEIRPPNGPDDLQKVRGRIAFRDAVVEFRGPPGSRASCAELGDFPVPSHQTFQMTSAARRGSCTLIPPPGSGLPVKPFDVTLSPGRVSSVPPGS